MKTKNMYRKRLLKLANHLGTKHLNEVLFNKEKVYSSNKAGCAIEHFDWAIAELPKLEPWKWMINEKGHPYLDASPKLSALTGVAIYFNLTGDELFHLFVPGYQDTAYMGEPLGENATPDEFAKNVYQFVEFKEAENAEKQNVYRIKKMKNEKVIKKFKLKNVA